ncbi:tyrosine-protein phosphatase non-receptor type 9-like [Anneissia japonica]|uniref:tyrosine-protein phosphatase non-receptor type 9-like n=1 Tax=Anneissia japonica TaxID=1529436 RepID=UPI001425982C|nr:tyrosine-protein phosphatase non-receptor type 9-like [Anneissia japonica]XP_033109524.1 tyrosine-protein phosphatase non-receptor type 9-like [Anneissia japonica]
MMKFSQIWRTVTRHSNVILVISVLLLGVMYIYNTHTTQDDTDMGPKLSEKNSKGDACILSPRVSKSVRGSEGIHRLDDKGTMTPMELLKHMETIKQHGISKEYEAVSTEMPSGSFSYSRNSNNLSKNRYSNVPCFDHSRVKLETSHDLSSDYINANYVDGFMQKHAFIAAQGPLPNTVNDFWKMIWQENVFVIVMTTQTEERGLTKCSQYWPTAPHLTLKFGDFTIDNLKVDIKNDYTVTTLLVNNSKIGMCRNVAHFHFTGWPDFGVPTSAATILQFRDEIRQNQREAVASMGSYWTGHPGGPPILVHCSAGIGRTGTFCAIDISLSRLEATQKLNIYDTVRKMRRQRAFSIQTPEQYEFCHFAVLERLQQQGKIPTVDWSKYRN